MQATETVSDTNCCQIVSIAEFGSRKKDQIERWIEKRMLEEYGEKDEVHLSTKIGHKFLIFLQYLNFIGQYRLKSFTSCLA